MKRLEAFFTKKLLDTDKDTVVEIPVDELTPNPYQPRKDFDEDELAPLAESIAQFGIIQPIIVKRRENVPSMTINGECVRAAQYEIIAGERRWRAARMIYLKTVPCVVREADENNSVQLTYVENALRKDLNFFEEAYAIHNLITVVGLTQSEAAEKFHLSQSAIANKLRLLRYSKAEQELILKYGFTERHARSIIRIDNEESRIRVIEKVYAAEMNAAECDKYVNKYLNGPSGKWRTAGKQKESGRKGKRIAMISDVRFFLNSVNKAVGIITEAGINVERRETDMGDYIEMILKIPKRNA